MELPGPPSPTTWCCASCGQGLGLGSDFAYQGAAINTNITATSNWMESNGTVCNDAGLIVGDGVHDSLIFDNSFVNNNFNGVQFLDEGASYPTPQNVAVKQNTIANLTPARIQKTGINLSGLATGVTLSGNNVYDNGTSLANQIVISGSVQVNSDWSTANTIN